MQKGNVFNTNLQQENEVLRVISGMTCDVTFVYDLERDTAMIVTYKDGVTESEVVIDHFERSILKRVHPDDLLVFGQEVDAVHHDVDSVNCEVRLKESDGRRYRWHSIHMRKIVNNERIFYAGSSSYIDNRKKRESELTMKARQDPLTGLLNKEVTRENVSEYILSHPNSEGIMIVFDIDNFKSYNDCIGHLFGDEIIKEVANRIQRIFGHNSIVGRIGGDEFLVFEKGDADITQLVVSLGKLQESLRTIKLGQRSFLNVTASIGVSLFPDQGINFDALFEKADLALYHVKNNGRSGYAVYTDDLFAFSNVESRRSTDILDAIEEAKDYSITNFAFHLLNEATDASAAINLLLYKLQNEYNVDGIYINELSEECTSTVVNYESVRKEENSKLGYKIEFSYEAWKARSNALKKDGYMLFDKSSFLSSETNNPGDDFFNLPDIQSALQLDMRLFSKNRGCINVFSHLSADIWDSKRINELKEIANLLTVCLYYVNRVNRAEEKVLKFSENDPLTGLMREEAFTEAAEKVIFENGRSSRLAVVYADISNFKYINETYGYMMGDTLLRDMGEYISKRISNVLCAGRFYSDNILAICRFERGNSDQQIARTIEDISISLSTYLGAKRNINNLYVRTGIYLIPDMDTDPLIAISNANLARKIAKESQGTRCVVFSQEMFEKRKKELEYIQQLDAAIANNEFFVCLQPKVSGNENKLVGAEALVRWKRPDGTILYPGEFVPTFEKDGSIVKLDFYVYEKVLAYLRERLDAHKRVVPISLNVSRVHLVSPDLVDKLKYLIDKYQVPTQFLELEITESVYLENLNEFDDTLSKLRNLGIRISMDDFGSGYSSLNALNNLRIDLLKIDRIFMRDNELKESDKTIIRFIIDMAKNLSMQVLCEGVETNSQREFLNEAGCELHQGFLYSKPVDMDTFDCFLDNEEMLFARVG